MDGSRCAECLAALPPRVRLDEHASRSWRWRKTSKRIRAASPFCEYPGCGTDRDLTVDHVDPLSMGGREFGGEYRVLCRHHHGVVWREQRERGGGPA